jgi:hypothetical protein
LDAECSTAEGNGTTEAELSACAAGFLTGAANLAAEIDGVAVTGLEDPAATIYRVQSPLFNFTLPADNILGLPAQTSPSAADGFYLMVAPLPVGKHVLHFHGEVPGFLLDVTYAPLTVTPS